MKKLMIAAAVAAMTVGAFAAGCQETPDPVDCQTVFNVKFSGKTATENKDATYKAIQKLSAKGTLTLATDVVEEFSQIKVGKTTLKDVKFEGGNVTKFTYFGKNLATVLDKNLYKSGKTYTLESDLGVSFASQTDYAININQVAFGKVKVTISKDKTIKSDCGEPTEIPGCLPYVTPGNFAGWFTGDFTPTCLDEANYNDYCYEFAGSTIAIFGGTWTAKYNKKASVAGTVTTL